MTVAPCLIWSFVTSLSGAQRGRWKQNAALNFCHAVGDSDPSWDPGAEGGSVSILLLALFGGAAESNGFFWDMQAGMSTTKRFLAPSSDDDVMELSL